MALFKTIDGNRVAMTAQEEADFIAANTAAADVRAALVPSFVGQYQWRTALRQMNRAAAFRNYVLAADETTQEYWQHKKVIKRNAPEVEAARVAFGVTQNQMDAVFKLAESIED
jgi:hypothetical protein